jgi:hypothetical protein
LLRVLRIRHRGGVDERRGERINSL